MGPLLAIFPHPDDETFSAGGLMAAAVERGVPVTVISATRGEAGESSIVGLDDPERLGAVRERELRDAMREIGVGDVRLLDYRDSGLQGSAAAEHPRAFVRVPVEAAAAQLVPLVRAIRPQVVVTFGPDGMYGHPDHLHTYRATVQAVTAAADSSHRTHPGTESWQTPALYFATFPREVMLAVLDRPNSPLEFVAPEARANLGTPRAAITHVLNISPWAERKRAALAAHRTQTGEGGPLATIPPDVVERQLTREYFVRAPLPWSSGTDEDIVSMLARDQASP